MTTKTTKRALLMSALALFLCFSMLIGTTFAWFTDEVKSATNIIAAGNLDVELYNGLDTTALKVGPTTSLFDEVTLWEPGVVAYENLTVANKGNLALKYQLAVNIVDLDGLKSLADVLKVAVVENGVQTNDRKELIASINNWMDFTSFVEAGELDKDQTKTYGLVIWWEPSDKDNDYNMNNENQGQVLSAEIGIVLEATQLVAEEDSFGPEYDEDAWAEGMQVHTADDLSDALANGEDVVLMADITTDKMIEITEDVKIDLNGKKLITNLAISADADVAISNGEITSASPANSAIETVGNLTLDNVTVSSNRHGVRVEGGKTVINGGTYTAAGYAGRTQHALNVSDGAEVIINGGTFIGPKGTASDSGSAINVQAGSTVTINGGNFSGGKTKTLAAAGTLIVYGGTFDQDPSAYVAAGFDAVKNGNLYYVLAEGTVIATPATAQDVINNAADGTTVLLFAGEYSTTLVMRSNITIEGTADAVVDCVNLNGASNVTLKNIEFDAAGAKMAYGGDGKVRFPANIVGRDSSNKSAVGARNIVIDGCTFTGNFADGGMTICFSDQTKAQSGDITIKGCTFETTGGYVDIYTYYAGYGKLVIENNTFASDCFDCPIYLGRYQSSTPVVVKGNEFVNESSFADAATIQAHSNAYTVSFDEADNTFKN